MKERSSFGFPVDSHEITLLLVQMQNNLKNAEKEQLEQLHHAETRSKINERCVFCERSPVCSFFLKRFSLYEPQ